MVAENIPNPYVVNAGRYDLKRYVPSNVPIMHKNICIFYTCTVCAIVQINKELQLQTKENVLETIFPQNHMKKITN